MTPKSRTLGEDDIWLSPTLIDTPFKSVFNSGDLNVINSVFETCVLLAQWITWLTQDRCNPKFPSSIPAGGKDFP